MSRNVLVTGLGPVTSIGVGAGQFREAQHAAISGIRHVEWFAPEDDMGPCIAGEVRIPDELALPVRQQKTIDRTAQLALIAAGLAIKDSSLDLDAVDRSRVGVVIGTGSGNMYAWIEGSRTARDKGPGYVSPRTVPKTMSNAAAAMVAITYGVTGPVTCPSVACASGAEALVAAHQMIDSGEADVVIAGGAEAPIVPAVVGAFRQARALSSRVAEPAAASRPFSADRDGFVIAEGAGVLILETEEHALARGATGQARLAGYGRTCDAFNITAPRPDGSGARRAIEAAMNRAHLTPGDISHVNAHGTGTEFNDAAEAAAISAVLGNRRRHVPVSSTKSQTGHAIGAASAIEAIATIQAISTGILPPTLNLTSPDPAFDLEFVGPAAREHKVTAALSNSFGFGGHNVVLAFLHM